MINYGATRKPHSHSVAYATSLDTKAISIRNCKLGSLAFPLFRGAIYLLLCILSDAFSKYTTLGLSYIGS